jgi:hypothetical protein
MFAIHNKFDEILSKYEKLLLKNKVIGLFVGWMESVWMVSLFNYIGLQGSNDDIIVAGFLQQFFNFLQNLNVSVTMTPIAAAHILNQVSFLVLNCS